MCMKHEKTAQGEAWMWRMKVRCDKTRTLLLKGAVVVGTDDLRHESAGPRTKIFKRAFNTVLESFQVSKRHPICD